MGRCAAPSSGRPATSGPGSSPVCSPAATRSPCSSGRPRSWPGPPGPTASTSCRASSAATPGRSRAWSTGADAVVHLVHALDRADFPERDRAARPRRRGRRGRRGRGPARVPRGSAPGRRGRLAPPRVPGRGGRHLPRLAGADGGARGVDRRGVRVGQLRDDPLPRGAGARAAGHPLAAHRTQPIAVDDVLHYLVAATACPPRWTGPSTSAGPTCCPTSTWCSATPGSRVCPSGSRCRCPCRCRPGARRWPRRPWSCSRRCPARWWSRWWSRCATSWCAGLLRRGGRAMGPPPGGPTTYDAAVRAALGRRRDGADPEEWDPRPSRASSLATGRPPAEASWADAGRGRRRWRSRRTRSGRAGPRGAGDAGGRAGAGRGGVERAAAPRRRHRVVHAAGGVRGARLGRPAARRRRGLPRAARTGATSSSGTCGRLAGGGAGERADAAPAGRPAGAGRLWLQFTVVAQGQGSRLEIELGFAPSGLGRGGVRRGAAGGGAAGCSRGWCGGSWAPPGRCAPAREHYPSGAYGGSVHTAGGAHERGAHLAAASSATAFVPPPACPPASANTRRGARRAGVAGEHPRAPGPHPLARRDRARRPRARAGPAPPRPPRPGGRCAGRPAPRTRCRGPARSPTAPPASAPGAATSTDVVGRRLPGRPGPRRGLDQGPGEQRDDDGLLDLAGDVGHPDLHRRVRRGEPGVEVDHPLVEDGAGRDHVGHGRVVRLGAPEERRRARARPPRPHQRAVARVPGVVPAPERRVGRDRAQHRQPGPDAVQHPDALLARGDLDVHVLAVGQLLGGDRAEALEDAAVAPGRRGRAGRGATGEVARPATAAPWRRGRVGGRTTAGEQVGR